MMGRNVPFGKYLGLVLISVLSLLNAFGQIQNDFLNNNISRVQLEQYLPKGGTQFHSAIQPYEFLDSNLTVLESNIFTPAKREISLNNGSENLSFNLEPLLVMRTRLDERAEMTNGLLAFGFTTNIKYKNKLHFRSSLFSGYSEPIASTGYYDYNIAEGISQTSEDLGKNLNLLNFNAALTYLPNDIFALQIGRGKHKFGDGHRSLLLSENAVNYPYAKIRTRVWNIEYINLFSSQRSFLRELDPLVIVDYPPYEAYRISYKRKFTSSHLLSWNINSDVNIYFFETIIWQNEDTLSTRGFDINYLNPIIFFRPVEFSVGSSDNAIVGAGSSWKVNKKLQIYGQFMIDEMIFKEFINRTGWWANKYGAQLGFKVYDPFKSKDTYFQMEWNQVRPFTYSHGSTQQNYAHFNQALAHPAGSNFYEFLALFVKDIKHFQVQLNANFLLKGNDIPGFGDEPYQNLGGDIFQSYVDPHINYGNIVGQGQTANDLNLGANVAYVFDQKSDGRISLGYNMGYLALNNSELFQHSFNIGVSLNFAALP